MSVRTNPMKAVPLLLRRVRTTRNILLQEARDKSLDAKLGNLTWELNNIKDLFMRVKENEEELLDTLNELDGHLRRLDWKRLDQDMDDICKRIRDSAKKLLPMDASASQGKTKPFDSSQDHKNELLDQDYLSLILESHPIQLPDQLRNYLYSLLVFPEGAVINKRHTIFWWIGEGIVTDTAEKTAEEVGEDVIDELLKFNLIVPYGNGKCPVVNKFKINPRVHRQAGSLLVKEENQRHVGFSFRMPYHHTQHAWLVLEQRKVTLGDANLKPDQCTTVCNVGASYLNFDSQWFAKMKNLKVLQLGRWQDSPSHHIEVGSEEFLKELRKQTTLKYLSLRGISRIHGLPPSIAQLESLEILDLKACHNLENLPSDIASMKSLTHLILSQCCLLEGMPKGIEKLTQLQVLKGFIIGSSSKTPCRISDLANLKKLRQLSIHIGSEAEIKDKGFQSLGELSALEHLKISWGVSGPKYSDIEIILPSSLKKLHLERFPGQKIPEWLKPSKLPSRPELKHSLESPHTFEGFLELKIKGGKLESLNHDEDMKEWGMQIVRLKYLKHLKVDLKNLQELFPWLRYAEIKQVLNHSYFEWGIY